MAPEKTDIEEILADVSREPISNAEAALLLQDSYRKKKELFEKRKKSLHLNPLT